MAELKLNRLYSFEEIEAGDINDNVLKLIKVADNIREEGYSDEYYKNNIFFKLVDEKLKEKIENKDIRKELEPKFGKNIYSKWINEFNKERGTNIK